MVRVQQIRVWISVQIVKNNLSSVSNVEDEFYVLIKMSQIKPAHFGAIMQGKEHIRIEPLMTHYHCVGGGHFRPNQDQRRVNTNGRSLGPEPCDMNVPRNCVAAEPNF